MEHFNPNGVVIQATNTTKVVQKLGLTGTEYQNYRGLDNYNSWPLNFDVDPVSQQLSHELDARWFNPPLEHPTEFYKTSFVAMVLSDRDFCIKYIEQCHKRSIETRVLFCFTERPEPQWDSRLPELKFLGFDHAITNYPDSSIFWDLLGEPPIERTESATYRHYLECKNKLNEYSLFDTAEDMTVYTKARKEVLADPSTHNFIEDDSDEDDNPYLVFKLYELMGDL